MAVGEELVKNEELLKFEKYQNNKLEEINNNLTEKINFKENQLLNYDMKIEEIRNEIERFSDSQMGIDMVRLNKNLESQIAVAKDLTRNNVKVLMLIL